MKKALKILVAVLLIFVGISTALFFYFQKNIQPILVAEINKSLAVRVSVDDITVSRIQDFPKIGVRLSNISVEESTPYYKDKLIQANELNLYINLVKLYQGKYVIDEVSIRGGTINIVDLDNSNNYDIIKSSDDKKSSNISFEIDQLKLLNCDIKYNHTPSQTKINGFTSSSNIGIKYNNSSTFLRIKSDFNNLHLSLDNNSYVSDKNVSLNTKVSVNTNLKTITIDPSILKIENIILSTHGKINYDDSSLVDIKFKNERADAKDLIRVMPDNLKRIFEDFKLDGDLSINGFINGNTTKNGKLSVGFDYEIMNGNLILKENKIGINRLNAKGKFSIPNIEKVGNSKFNCVLKSASNGSNQLEGEIAITDFEKPKIKWQGKALLDPIFITQFMDSSNFIPSAGDIKLDGELSLVYDINQSKIAPNTFNYNGAIVIKDIQGEIVNPGLTIHRFNAEVQSKDNSLIIQNAQINYNQSNVNLDGYINNVASIFDNKSQAKFIGNLEIDNLYVNELLSDDTNVKSESNNIELSPIQFEITTKIDRFKINDFTAKSVNGTLISNKKSIRLAELKMTALDGTVDGEISIRNWGNNYLLDIQSELHKVNIKKLFSQFNNFYQNEITYKNIKGMLDGSIIAKLILNQNYEPILPKLYAKSTITIKNGALTGYEPLKELSSFVHVEDLENVKFKTLSNSIEIFDKTIFIPKMKIENNALNLQIEGTHTFDNLMSYAMEISLAELLATKANWIAKKAEKRIERNKKGGLTAYVIMEGTPDDLKIKYDRSTVKENIKEEVKNEKERFIQTLKGESTLQDREKKAKNYNDIWDE